MKVRRLDYAQSALVNGKLIGNQRKQKLFIFSHSRKRKRLIYSYSNEALNGRKKVSRLIIHQYALLGLRAMETYNWLVQVQLRYL